MLVDLVRQHLPAEWTSMSSYSSDDYELVDIPPYSSHYKILKSRVQGSFNLETNRIVRVQNPYLYGQFLLKKEEYATRGCSMVNELYHDTAGCKVSSIVSSNLDWRLANRVKYGRGVSFSPSPTYANQQSSRDNGTNRAMVIAQVLVGSSEHVSGSKELPNSGYDTSIGNCNNVYVKYYDNEFYPKYVVYYESRSHVYRRRYW